MPESAQVRLLSFWWRAQAVHRCIVCDDRGHPDTGDLSWQISAPAGRENAHTPSSEPHASTERPHPHAYKDEPPLIPEMSPVWFSFRHRAELPWTNRRGGPS